jgi:hypothetical protein
MTVKKLISISDELNSMIKEYNERHPFEKLRVSDIAQKAIYERIFSIEPELTLDRPKVIKMSKKNDNKPIKERNLHDIEVEHYTDKLERTVAPPAKEPASLKAQEKEIIKSKPIKKLVENEPEPPHKAPVTVHENVHMLKHEPISGANYDDNESGTVTCINEFACFVTETKEPAKETEDNDFLEYEIENIDPVIEEPIMNMPEKTENKGSVDKIHKKGTIE